MSISNTGHKSFYADIIQLLMNKPYLVNKVPATFHANMELIYDSQGKIVEPPFSPAPWETYSTRLPIYMLVHMFKNEVDFEFNSREDMYEIYGYMTDYFHWLQDFKQIPDDHHEFYTDCRPFYRALTSKCQNMSDAFRRRNPTPKSFFDKILGAGIR